MAQFLQFFEEWCEGNISDRNSRIIICGDFNINLLEKSLYTDRLTDILVDMDFKNWVREITHITNTGGSLIDLVLSNVEVIVSIFDSPKIGTHRNISICLKNVETKQIHSFYLETRGKQIDFSLIEQKLLEVTWNYAEKDLDNRYNWFIGKILGVLDAIAPKKIVKIFKHYKEFWNENVKRATKDRDEYFRLYKMDKTIERWEAYKQKRNMAVKTIREEKKKYLEVKIDLNKNNPAEMWKTLKDFVPNNIQENNFNTIDIGNGEEISDINLMPDCLNEFYVKSITCITDEIDKHFINDFPIVDKITSNKLSNFRLVDRTELEKIVTSLKNKTSPDNISVELLKKCFNGICDPLLNIVNSSLELCKMPNEMKISTIVPIPKVPNTNQAINLRPVNMINATAKVLERIVYEQIVNYLENNKILCEYQSGFRSKHSCETALQCIINDWKNNMENNVITIAVFLDLQRAFETVDRYRLLGKVQSVGIDGMALTWVMDYLSNRQQRLKLNGIHSNRLNNDIGVPQGSVLGPLLFLIYLNDIVDVAGQCKIHLFADDTLLYFGCDMLGICLDVMNDTMERIYKYCCANMLKVNVNKTKWMLLDRKRKSQVSDNLDLHIQLGGNLIERVEKMVYLGVTVDSQLKFRDHANQIIKTIAYKVNYLRRCSPYLSQWSRLMVYNTIILPHFNFCPTVLYMIGQNETSRLQKLQNRAMRIILKCSRFTPISDMLGTLKWLPVGQYLEYCVLVLIYKIKTGQAPVYLQTLLRCNSDVHEHNTRNRNNYRIQKFKKTSTYNSVFYKGMDMFNNLPQDLKNCLTVNKFKVLLKDYFMET